MDEVDIFLAHHGVKGMKWGVVNKDKTSSKPSKSRAEKKADRRAARVEKYQSRSDKTQKKIDAVKSKTANNRLSKLRKNSTLRDLDEQKTKEDRDVQRAREGKLSVKQRNVAIGLAVAGGLLATYGAYKLHDSGEFARLAQKGKALMNGQENIWKSNDLLKKAMSPEELMQNVVRGINPNYGKYGTKQNCRRCTFAYEMRRRGFDVQATLSNAATGQHALGLENAITPGVKLPVGQMGIARAVISESIKEDGGQGPIVDLLKNNTWGKNIIDVESFTKGRSLQEQLSDTRDALTQHGELKAKGIFKTLSTQPDGARGELGVGWDMGGGHSIAWEIVRGKPVIFDAQSGEKYETFEEFTKTASNIAQAGFTRLDNLELNNDFLLKWVQNA